MIELSYFQIGAFMAVAFALGGVIGGTIGIDIGEAGGRAERDSTIPIRPGSEKSVKIPAEAFHRRGLAYVDVSDLRGVSAEAFENAIVSRLSMGEFYKQESKAMARMLWAAARSHGTLKIDRKAIHAYGDDSRLLVHEDLATGATHVSAS